MAATDPAPGASGLPATDPDEPAREAPTAEERTSVAVLAGLDVEPASLRAVLDGRFAAAREEARALLRSPALRPVDAGSREDQRAWTLEAARTVARSGVPLRGMPTGVGGGGDVGGTVVAFATLAMGDPSVFVKAGVQWGLFGGAILHLGTDRHHARYLPAIAALDLPGCFAMTETGHGSDVQSIRTTATYDAAAGEFVVDTPHEGARKDYIGNAARDGRLAVVFAQLLTGGEDHGVHALLVPIRDEAGQPLPGVDIGDDGAKGGINGVDNGRLAFAGVRVPREALLDRYARVAADGTYSSPIASETARFFTMLGTLVQGRVSVAGAANNAAMTALVTAVRYAEARRQFQDADGREVVLLDYLAHQRRLLPAIARTYALHLAQSALVTALHDQFVPKVEGDARPGGGSPTLGADAAGPDDADPGRDLETAAAGIKALATWTCLDTLQTCREACGGNGYLAENRLVGLRADLDVFATFEGDNTVLLQLVAKSLLSEYREQVGQLESMGMLRLVADQLLDNLVERTAARGLVRRVAAALPGGRDGRAGLLDRTQQLALVVGREQHVLAGLARRLRRAMAEGEAFAAFNSMQDHVLEAARAHVERLVVDAFAAAVEGCDDPAARALLGAVCDLHVLSLVEQHKGWYLEHDRLTAGRAKAVTAAVNELCRVLRPHARTLVAAFGVPEEVLGPIARGAEERRQAEAAAHATAG